MSGNCYRVYVIKNQEGRIYIGLSENIQTRLQQHNDGVSKWTKNRGPWALMWTSAEMSLSEARKLEMRLKRQKGGIGLQHLLIDMGASGS